MPMHTFRTVQATEIVNRINEFNDILIDCVAGGASVSFMHPLSLEKATAFWLSVAQSVRNNERVVLVALSEQQRIIGTVQLLTSQPENQPHRADVAKLMVHSLARRCGIAQQLMQQLEQIALKMGRNVLVLDTSSGSDAELFYQNNGWLRVGVIPEYALMPDGELCSTTIYYRHL